MVKTVNFMLCFLVTILKKRVTNNPVSHVKSENVTHMYLLNRLPWGVDFGGTHKKEMEEKAGFSFIV